MIDLGALVVAARALRGLLHEGQRRGGRAGGQATLAMWGRDHFREIGRRGGLATRARLGPQFYRQIGRQGAQQRAANLAARRAEALRQEAAPGVALVSRARSPLALSIRLRLRAPR